MGRTGGEKFPCSPPPLPKLRSAPLRCSRPRVHGGHRVHVDRSVGACGVCDDINWIPFLYLLGQVTQCFRTNSLTTVRRRGEGAPRHSPRRIKILRKDLKWCPIFGNLKPVLLNEWCLTDNFTGLVLFLEPSPILEKLTLQLHYDKDFESGSSESYNPMESFLLSKHLKVVEIHCSKEDERISQIVKILGIHGVTPVQISIQHDSWHSSWFSFEQRK
ncbi:uncharacterized protein LOC119271787 [Triticum dicoccoides]|uniref:uncharacterized protein LOC119271787 n=1 Tax=Triticum dicoccoides TaxID=85692 RepID=UPI0018904D73|nr:uncharacterized protein LOC119271787 [Triticum dicoccoides]